MPAQYTSSSAGLQKLTAKTAQYEAAFQKAYPELYKQIQVNQNTFQSATNSGTAISVESAQITQLYSQPFDPGLITQITLEEYQAVIDKAVAITHLPPGNLDIETALYLEQQLGDLLNLEIATRLQGQELLHTHGTIKALPHLKRSPTDTVQAHDYSRAPYADHRGYYGWLHQNMASETDPEQLEKYYIALPLYLLKEWESQALQLKKWYAFRKVVVVNPHEQLAVVCAVTDSFEMSNHKYQFGASPEVILEGLCWSPKALGKVLLFFIHDDSARIPLGPISFAQRGIYA